jgi:predicted permease
MREIWSDLKIAGRRLRHAPGFALMAVLSLALAIAANLVVFGVMNAAVLRPLNVNGADRLYLVAQKPHGYITQSYPDYQDFRARNTTLSGMLAYRISEAGVSVQGLARKSWDYEVTGDYFDVLGVKPELGRFFHASEEHGVNSVPYIVLSDAMWRSRFGGDPRVIGTTVDVNRHPFTVIGVAPPAFHGTELFLWPDFWVPMVDAAEIDGWNYLERRYNHNLFVLGRLGAGVTAQQAAANLNAIAAQLAKQYPGTDDGMGVRLLKPGLFGDQLGDAAPKFLGGILLLALLTLAAACVNLASIFAARAADRGRELAVRMAIGSSRWRLLQQVVAEAVLLSAAGAALGTATATWLLQVLSVWQPIAEYPIHVAVAADMRVYGLAVALAIASGVLPALLTARQIWRTDAMQAMKGAGRLAFGRMTLRDALLVLQVALCALLLTSALVGARGMQRSLHAPLGFDPARVTLAEMEMKMAGYSDQSALPVQKKMIEEAKRIPGATAAGTIDEEPLNAGGSSTPVYRDGTRDFRSSESVFTTKFFTISPGYLEAARTRLLAGRDFTWHDDERAPHVIIVNETFARRMFGSAEAVGKRIAMPGPNHYEIVGVVEDGKYDSLTEDARPAMFWPLAQNPENDTTLVVRSVRPAADTANAISVMLRKVDPNLPVTIESWPDALALVLFPARVATVALGILGVLAAVLAATGIFGMASYTVARRLREMGIRVALGAQRIEVLRASLGRTVLLLGGGSLAGLVLGLMGSRVLASIVYEATAYDPLVLTVALLLMVAIGAAAALVPARRAMQVDPAVLLREE